MQVDQLAEAVRQLPVVRDVTLAQPVALDLLITAGVVQRRRHAVVAALVGVVLAVHRVEVPEPLFGVGEAVAVTVGDLRVGPDQQLEVVREEVAVLIRGARAREQEREGKDGGDAGRSKHGALLRNDEAS